jgi:hypothetical protein
MSNYTKTVDFAAKDTLPSGDSGKIIKGTEFETEFDNISTAIATKADSAAPTFTGTSVFTNLDINGTVQADGAVTVGVDDTGYDVKFFGATAGKSLLWDESADSLIVTGTTTLVGTTNLDAVDVDGDMTFGDNNKAIFGADSDLQIYHNGTDSIIEDIGTGNLDIKTNGAYILLRNTDGNNLAYFQTGGGSHLYWNGASGLGRKLQTTATGIDVTGSVTADGLTVSSDSGGPVYLQDSNATATYNISELSNNAGNFGIQTRNSSGTFVSTDYQIVKNASGADYHRWFTQGTERMRIDASGNVGIGTSSISYPFVVSDGGNLGFEFSPNDQSTGVNRLYSYDRGTSAYKDFKLSASEIIFGYGSSGGNEAMRIDSSGNLQIAGTGVGNTSNTITFKNGAVAIAREDNNLRLHGFDNMIFGVSGTSYPVSTERMRIDSSGNLLLGKTSSANAQTTVGHLLLPDGRHYATASGGPSGIFSRTTSDGDILSFYQGSTPTLVGSIGTGGGNLNIGNGTANLRFTSGSISPSGTTAGGSSNGVTDLGLSSRRFKDLYLSGGVVFGTTGGSVSSKTLDDYEEGTWTPTLYYQNATGVTRTYTEQTGHYTKIGNTVTVWCTLKGGTSNSGSYANDNIGISGLPFSVIGGNATAPVRQSGFAGTASVGTLCMLLTSSVALLSTPEDANNLADDLGAGATYTLTFSGSYETTE